MAAAGDMIWSMIAISAVPPPAPTTAVSADVQNAAMERNTISGSDKEIDDQTRNVRSILRLISSGLQFDPKKLDFPSITHVDNKKGIVRNATISLLDYLVTL